MFRLKNYKYKLQLESTLKTKSIQLSKNQTCKISFILLKLIIVVLNVKPNIDLAHIINYYLKL